MVQSCFKLIKRVAAIKLTEEWVVHFWYESITIQSTAAMASSE